MLDPEAAIEAHLGLARRHGAEPRFDEPLLSWKAEGEAAEVTTSRATYRAARLVLAVGAWTPRVLAPLELPLVVERNVVAWFDTTRGHTDAAGRGAPAGRNAWSAADVLADPEAKSRPAVGVVAGAEALSEPAVGVVAGAEARSRPAVGVVVGAEARSRQAVGVLAGAEARPEPPPGRAEDLFAPGRSICPVGVPSVSLRGSVRARALPRLRARGPSRAHLVRLPRHRRRREGRDPPQRRGHGPGDGKPGGDGERTSPASVSWSAPTSPRPTAPSARRPSASTPTPRTTTSSSGPTPPWP